MLAKLTQDPAAVLTAYLVAIGLGIGFLAAYLVG